MAALFLYVVVFQVLGFIVSTFLLLVYLFKGLEPQSWRNALLLSAVTIAICYLVFGVFLELQFPPGVLQLHPGPRGIYGFSVGLQIGVVTAFQPMNLLYCFIGVLIGTLIGVLPGIGTSGAVAISCRPPSR